MLILVVTGLFIPALHAQYVTNYKNAADGYYNKGDYYSAARYYEKYISGESPVHSGYTPYAMQKQGTRIGNRSKLPAGLVYRLADCYFRLNDFEHAASWFKMLVDKFPGMYPQARYWYAVCLRSKGDYMSALQQLELFVVQYPVNDQYSQGAQHELDICLFIRRQLSNPLAGITIQKLNSINILHDTASCTPDGSRMYFTGSLVNKEGEKRLAVYTREKKGGSWSEAVLAGGNVNTAGCNAKQPQVTFDGKYLLFASDRSGGLGGYDIWYAALDGNGQIGAINNMGTAINTEADEGAPFYHVASNTLVFASKGRIGMGGYDLFSSAGSFTTAWKEAINLGYLVNSMKDDTWLISKGNILLEDALICSDRLSSCCLEIFSVNKSDGNSLAAGR